MYDSTRNRGSRWFGPHRAKEEIGASFGGELTNALFVMSEKELDEAWRKYRRFAHLAAALLLFIAKKGWTRFQEPERECWRKEIDDYLAYAQFFQEFLEMFGGKSHGSLQRPGYIRFRCDLFKLPPQLELQAWSPREDDRLLTMDLAANHNVLGVWRIHV